VLGGNLDGSYEAYCMLTAVLAFNRLLHMTSARSLERVLFGPFAMKIWYLLTAVVWLLHIALEVSPFLKASYFAYYFTYSFDGDPALVDAFVTVIKFESMASFIAAAALHLVILVLILVQ
ncbi:hypothetical protein AAVH_33799, partial [Aphelenchoides avenae]